MPFWLDNIEAWFCYAEADFHEHGVNDTRAQFLAVVKALPRELNRYVTPSMLTSDVSEPNETLKRSILKRGDPTDRQRLNQLFNNIDLQHGSATDMLQRMREPDNIEAWFCYAEADFYEHGVNDTRAQFLAVVKALPHELNRYVTPSMLTSDVSELYEALKLSIFKGGGLTDRQGLDQLPNNIDQ
ncbi:unnamed protein product [Schistosoma margrebowiei]|uniref:DUF7041 domain-containing protein n=1 Tax=Schistosoma margrebowiei TaxID=48269 RepID=A0A183N313_9TREM|nr:unnamed protein product [Schistosoma margrebowiei]